MTPEQAIKHNSQLFANLANQIKQKVVKEAKAAAAGAALTEAVKQSQGPEAGSFRVSASGNSPDGPVTNSNNPKEVVGAGPREMTPIDKAGLVNLKKQAYGLKGNSPVKGGWLHNAVVVGGAEGLSLYNHFADKVGSEVQAAAKAAGQQAADKAAREITQSLKRK